MDNLFFDFFEIHNYFSFGKLFFIFNELLLIFCSFFIYVSKFPELDLSA